MKFKTVSQCNGDGYFIGLTDAQEDPRNPSSYLLPADAIDIESPTEKEGVLFRLNDTRSGWVEEKIQPPASEPDPEPLTPQQVLQNKLVTFKNQSDMLTCSVREEYPTDEVLSWSKQEIEARAYLADKTAPVPLLSAIAENRSIPLALLAEKVVEKADAYAGFTGQIFGIRQALEDRLLAVDLDAPDAIDQINAIQWPAQEGAA